jgi:hypothetical protein
MIGLVAMPSLTANIQSANSGSTEVAKDEEAVNSSQIRVDCSWQQPIAPAICFLQIRARNGSCFARRCTRTLESTWLRRSGPPVQMHPVKPLRTAATLLVLSKLPKPGLFASKPAVCSIVFALPFLTDCVALPLRTLQYDYRILLVHRSQKSAFMVSARLARNDWSNVPSSAAQHPRVPGRRCRGCGLCR